VEGKRFGFFEGYIWNLEGLNTTKDLWTTGFPAKYPTQDSPETRH
jgi:hypothetical protein